MCEVLSPCSGLFCRKNCRVSNCQSRSKLKLFRQNCITATKKRPKHGCRQQDRTIFTETNFFSEFIKTEKDRTCSPQQPMALMMEALWITLYLIPFSFARSTKSVCVVALQNEIYLKSFFFFKKKFSFLIAFVSEQRYFRVPTAADQQNSMIFAWFFQVFKVFSRYFLSFLLALYTLFPKQIK